MENKTNQSVNKNNRKPQGGHNAPSAKSNGKPKAEPLQFKKALYGYDVEEVSSYIRELNESYRASSKILESKLSSVKEELVLSNRERDSYMKKYMECQAKLSVDTQSIDKTAEYEASIISLNEKIRALEGENAQLKRLTTINKDDVINTYAKKISVLKSRNAELEAKENEYKTMTEEAEKKNEIINKLSVEAEISKKMISELEIRVSVLTQCVEESESKISILKEANKNAAYENAEKLSVLEGERTKDRLAAQKDLKLCSYYADRADLTLAELARQLEQMKQSLEKIQL